LALAVLPADREFILKESLIMATIAIQRARETSSLPRQLVEEMESIGTKIRAKAHEIFLHRGSSPGRELDDWLEAERQLMWMPDTEVVEKPREFQARIDIAGVEPKDIRLIALPDSILLQAEPKSREAKLFQRFTFSTPIDVEKVTAKLERGILEINAPKVRAAVMAARGE
jgi:HSP20 family molecular chaperone IbpA